MERNVDVVSNNICSNIEILENYFESFHENANYIKCVEKLKKEKVDIDSLNVNEVKTIFEALIFSLEQN